MNSPTLKRLVLGAALAMGAATAFADDLLPLPADKQSGAVSFTSGGIPDEQLPAVRQARAGYPLVLELFQKDGKKNQYLADVQVRLTNAKGEVVLDDRSEGPFMLVRTPPGTYKVEATFQGKTLEQRGVAVGASGSKRVVFVFPPSAS